MNKIKTNIFKLYISLNITRRIVSDLIEKDILLNDFLVGVIVCNTIENALEHTKLKTKQGVHLTYETMRNSILYEVKKEVEYIDRENYIIRINTVWDFIIKNQNNIFKSLKRLLIHNIGDCYTSSINSDNLIQILSEFIVDVDNDEKLQGLKLMLPIIFTFYAMESYNMLDSAMQIKDVNRLEICKIKNKFWKMINRINAYHLLPLLPISYLNTPDLQICNGIIVLQKLIIIYVGPCINIKI
jgi:hypothetical protein